MRFSRLCFLGIVAVGGALAVNVSRADEGNAANKWAAWRVVSGEISSLAPEGLAFLGQSEATEPSDSPLDGTNDWNYTWIDDSGKPAPISVTPAMRRKARLMLDDASAMLQDFGFREPRVEKRVNFLTARLIPGDFVCEKDDCNPDDTILGVYKGLGGETVSDGRLYLSHLWDENDSAVTVHELFHGVQAAYDGFNRVQKDANGCATACWIHEGTAEGFAKYWAARRGAPFGFGPGAPFARTRTYDTTLSTGAGGSDYNRGLATARFWYFVAGQGQGYRPVRAILENGAKISENNGVKVVSSALEKGGLKPLGALYADFSTTLDARNGNDLAPGSRLRVNLRPEELDKEEREFSVPDLATKPIEIRWRDESRDLVNLKITLKSPDGRDYRMYLNRANLGKEYVAPVSKMASSGGNYSLWLKVVNANLEKSENEKVKLAFEWEETPCALLPASNVASLSYRVSGPDYNGTYVYNFTGRKQVGVEIQVNATVRFDITSQRVNGRPIRVQGTTQGLWKCGPKGVAMDGVMSGGGNLAGLAKVRENGPAQIKPVSNTLFFPKKPKIGQTLAGGAVSSELFINNRRSMSFTQTVSNRKVVGQQTVNVAGSAPLKCWKITGNISHSASAGGGMNDTILKNIAKQPFYRTPEGKRMLADPAFRRMILGATQSVLNIVTAQSSGTQTVLFKRGIGLVKTEFQGKTPDDKSSMTLVRVVYR